METAFCEREEAHFNANNVVLNPFMLLDLVRYLINHNVSCTPWHSWHVQLVSASASILTWVS